MKKRVTAYLFISFTISIFTPMIAQKDCGDTFERIYKLRGEHNWKAAKKECLSYLRHCGSNAQVEYILEKCNEEILASIKREAEQGDATAQNKLGNMYRNGDIVSQDKAQAIYWLKKAAQQGVPRAQVSLGYMYNNGEGVAQDYTQAVYWCQKAAEQGDGEGQTNLGNMYFYGKGVAQDYTKAVYWYRKAAEQGFYNGQYCLGIMYRKGIGVSQDNTQAIYWYTKAAEQGYDLAQFNLAYMYNYVPEVYDVTQAEYWYQKAAEQGYDKAQNNLGNIYRRKAEYTQAAYWYQKAAEQGFAMGQYNLGQCYEFGYGVEKNCSIAMMWYKKAIDGGIDAKETYNALAEQGCHAAGDMKIEPPLLDLIEGSLSFVDATNNQLIDPNEKCHINFTIQNNGKGAANNCEVRIVLYGESNGIIAQNFKLPSIEAGHSYDVSIPVQSNLNTQNGKVTFSIEISEPRGWGIPPFDMVVATKAYESPLLKIVDYAVTGTNGGALVKRKPFNLQLMLQNTQYGDAEDVEIAINLPNNVFLLDGKELTKYEVLEGGKAKSLDYQLIVNNNYSDSIIPIEITIQEKYGKYAENRNISLQLNQTLASTKLNIQAAEQNVQHKEIQLAVIGSAVDKNIPVSAQQNNNALVLIVSNENYQSMPTVPYAINDGNVFKEYCIKTLGIPQENIMYQADVTLNGFRQKVALLQKKAQARAQAGRETQIIFYYTGHGMPDVNTQSAYLMPIDGYDENIATGYKLDDLYQQLGQMHANKVTVFLDACFSGVNRNDKALAVHKGARLTAKSGAPTGNMVIFAASQGNQTASVNDKEGHGLFTYFLLKKLKASSGDVSLKELADYLSVEVNMKSLNLFEKEQVPSVVASPEVENQWQDWKLK